MGLEYNNIILEYLKTKQYLFPKCIGRGFNSLKNEIHYLVRFLFRYFQKLIIFQYGYLFSVIIPDLIHGTQYFPNTLCSILGKLLLYHLYLRKYSTFGFISDYIASNLLYNGTFMRHQRNMLCMKTLSYRQVFTDLCKKRTFDVYRAKY